MEVVSRLKTVYLIRTPRGKMVSYNQETGESRYVATGRKLSETQGKPVTLAVMGYIREMSRVSVSSFEKAGRRAIYDNATHTVTIKADREGLIFPAATKAAAVAMGNARALVIPASQLAKIEHLKRGGVYYYVLLTASGVIARETEEGGLSAPLYQGGKVIGELIDTQTQTQTHKEKKIVESDKKLLDVARLLYAYYGQEYQAGGQMISRLACEINNALEYHEITEYFFDVIDSQGAPKAAKSLFFDSQWLLEILEGEGSLYVSF